MKALHQLSRWAQTLSRQAEVVCAALLITVVGLLAAACPVYAMAADPPRGAAEDAATGALFASPTSVLSLPLPGTPQRQQAEAVRLLEEALADYDYITAAQVTFGANLTESETQQLLRLAIQLHINPAQNPPQQWVKNLATVVLHTVPELKPDNLLITDSSGRMLYEDGAPTAAVATLSGSPQPASVSARQSVSFTNFWATGGGLVGLLLAGGILLYLLRVRQAGSPSEAAPAQSASSQPSPLAECLDQFSAEQIASAIQGQGHEVMATVLDSIPDADTAAGVCQKLKILPDDLPRLSRQPRDEIIASLGQVLHTELTAATDGGPSQGDANE